MFSLGVIDFICKFIDNEKLLDILNVYGIYSGDKQVSDCYVVLVSVDNFIFEDQFDVYCEMVNIVMGCVGENLVEFFGEFIDLFIFNVNLFESNELLMVIVEINSKDSVLVVFKGFVSVGVGGEVLVIFNDINL